MAAFKDNERKWYRGWASV